MLLVGGLAAILLLTMLVFVTALASSVSHASSCAPTTAASQLYPSACKRYSKAAKLLVGATHSVQTTSVVVLPQYRPRYLCGWRRLELCHANKLATALLLVAVAVLFSRQYVPKWIGGLLPARATVPAVHAHARLSLVQVAASVRILK
jgi:hypothetical protein